MQNLIVSNENLARHYSSPGLKERVLAALEALEKEKGPLSPEDIAPLDEFHIRGRAATRDLAAILNPSPNQRVLDVGSGIGGPSRCLARDYGCPVIGIDLTEDYCKLARMLAQRVGLDETLTFTQGDALALPFSDASFDIVWTQHTAMNIADKKTLYAEMYRVLKPEGRLALYDVAAGPESPPRFPLPWAKDASMNFLLSPDELKHMLEGTGFTVSHWRTTSDLGMAWFENLKANKREAKGEPALGLHLIMGSDIRTMSRNVMGNLAEKRIILIEAVAQKMS